MARLFLRARWEDRDVSSSGMSIHHRIVGALSLTQIIGGLGNGAGLAVGALLIEDISGSASLAGLAVTFMMIGAATVTVPLSNLALRYGRRVALGVGWALGSVGAGLAVLGAVLESVPVVLLAFALFGVSSAANLQSRFAAADRAEPASVARSISIVVWSTTVGAVVGPNLTGPGAELAAVLSLPALAGPMVISAASFALASLSTWLLLRPEPLQHLSSAASVRPTLSDALPHVRGDVAVGIISITMSHVVMVSVMALTPVHMKHHEASLSIIGLTISLHIAGMYAASPVFGWLSDRWGAGRTIVLGQGLLALACLLAGTAGDSTMQITAGLILLGLGWSAAVISGAALVTSSSDTDVRPIVQGLSDLMMNVGGAMGGLLAGVIVWAWGFGTLTAIACLALVPVLLAVFKSGSVRPN